jgi:hypothetical protein
MDPVLIGRPILAISCGLLLLCALILPFLDRNSAEYTITLVSVVLNIALIIGASYWIRKTSMKKKDGEIEKDDG